MALWNGSNINSNETAMVFNQMAEKKARAIITKGVPLLNAFRGTADDDTIAMKVRQLVKINGKNLEVTLRGKNAVPTYVADGAAEVAVMNYAANYVGDIYGGAEFPIAHLVYGLPLPASEVERFQGKELKTVDYIGEQFDYVMDGYENLLANELSGSAAPTRTKVAGWAYAVSDDNTYGTIDRTDVANADFKGIVELGYGSVGLGKIQRSKNKVKANKGKVTRGVADLDVYNAIQQIAQSFTVVQYNEDKAMVGADNVVISGVEFIMSHRENAGRMGLFDPESWIWWQKDTKLTRKGIWDNPMLVDAYSLNTALWAQDICLQPNHNVRAEGCTP